MIRNATIAAFGALALAACGQQAQTTDAEPATVEQPAIPAAAAITNADFVQQVANADAYEVQAAEIAAERGMRAEVKTFAAQMRTDHTATSAELTALAPRIGVTAPAAAVTPDNQARLDALRGASGEAFDDLYLDQQVEAHENTVRLFQDYLNNAPAGELRTWAETTLPKLQAHHTHVQGLENAT